MCAFTALPASCLHFGAIASAEAHPHHPITPITPSTPKQPHSAKNLNKGAHHIPSPITSHPPQHLIPKEYGGGGWQGPDPGVTPTQLLMESCVTRAAATALAQPETASPPPAWAAQLPPHVSQAVMGVQVMGLDGGGSSGCHSGGGGGEGVEEGQQQGGYSWGDVTGASSWKFKHIADPHLFSGGSFPAHHLGHCVRSHKHKSALALITRPQWGVAGWMLAAMLAVMQLWLTAACLL